MSKDWTMKELEVVSSLMESRGELGYLEFCEELRKQGFQIDEAEIERFKRQQEYHFKSDRE